jgi:hypothetical protein
LFCQDTAFSIVVTALFLRPIYKVFAEASANFQDSAGYKSLIKMKWMTLGGASLAVVSSTALYINFLLRIVLDAPGSQWLANPYLNFFVFGANLDSVLNDTGMLLACGVLKAVDCSSLAKRFSRTASNAIEPDVSSLHHPTVPEVSSNAEGEESFADFSGV